MKILGRLDQGTKFPFAEKIHPAILFVVKLNKGEEKEGVKGFVSFYRR